MIFVLCPDTYNFDVICVVEKTKQKSEYGIEEKLATCPK